MKHSYKHLVWVCLLGLFILNSCEDSTTGPETDTTDPIITLNGDNPDTTAYGSGYSDPGATATDDVDGDVTAEITSTSDVDVYQQGTYTITYKVEDEAGNKASAVRTVFVYNPNQVAVSSIVGSYDVTENCSGNTYTEGAVISADVDDENFYIDHFYNGFLDNVLCTIDGKSIIIEEQDFENGAYSVEGTGSISISGSVVTITLTYTVTDNSNSSVQVCSSTYTK